jgi:hypothetical protein
MCKLYAEKTPLLKGMTVAHSTWHEKSLQPHFTVSAAIAPTAKPGNIGQYRQLG